MHTVMIHLAFIQNLGGPDLILILVIVLLLFGAKRMPELARGLGKSLREFKKAAAEVQEQIQGAIEDDKPTSPPATNQPAPAAPAAPNPGNPALPRDVSPPAPDKDNAI